MRKIHIDAWLGALFIAASLVFYKLSDEFAEFNSEAATWPRGVLVVTIILSVLLLIHGLRLTQQRAETEIPKGRVFIAPLIATVVIIAYAVTMEFTDYFISTAIFVPLGMFAQGQKSWKVILGVTAGLELFVYLLFVVGLGLRMP